MFAFKIPEAEIKPFMNKLLRENCFDEFQGRTVEIISIAQFQINGLTQGDNEYLFCTWSQLKAHVYNIIKCGGRPSFMRITLSLPQDRLLKLHENISAGFLNIIFEDGQLLCTAAVGEKQFSQNRSAAEAWKEFIQGFMQEQRISISTRL